MSDTDASLYELWKIEQRVWLEGPLDCADVISDDALLSLPAPFPVTRFIDLIALISNAEPFASAKLTERSYIGRAGFVVLNYLATAGHKNMNGAYQARCSTTYALEPGGWRVIAHHHERVKG